MSEKEKSKQTEDMNMSNKNEAKQTEGKNISEKEKSKPTVDMNMSEREKAKPAESGNIDEKENVKPTENKNIREKKMEKEYRVLVNKEEQYSLWAADHKIPNGWKSVGPIGPKEVCLSYVKEVWTDMRPKSLREKMDGLRS